MGPKKEAPKGGAGGEVVEGEDPAVLLKNYQTQSKLVGLPTHSGLVSAYHLVLMLKVKQYH